MSKRNHDYLYVVVDRFSKMWILMPCKKQVTSKQTAHMFFQHVWVHFGLPNSIIFYQDSRFLGNFWSSLCALMDTKLKRSTAFHPQTDGQTEVVNRTVVHLLRGYCSKHLSFGMNTYTTFNMLTTVLNIHRLKHLHLKHVLVICQNLL